MFEVTGKNPLLDIALKLEEVALSDDYFISRKLYPNVDFYSGLIYQALGFPVAMFTVLFAVAHSFGFTLCIGSLRSAVLSRSVSHSDSITFNCCRQSFSNVYCTARARPASAIAARSSGKPHSPNVHTTVSNEASGNGSACASASRSVTSRPSSGDDLDNSSTTGLPSKPAVTSQ